MGFIPSGWDCMQDNAVNHDRKAVGLKYLALGLCLAVFLLYGLFVA